VEDLSVSSRAKDPHYGETFDPGNPRESGNN
jgi:hypothetical protein